MNVGFHTKLDSFKFMTRIHYLAQSNGDFGEHEIDYVFLIKVIHRFTLGHFVANRTNDCAFLVGCPLAQADVDMDINPNEVAATQYINAAGLHDLLERCNQEQSNAGKESSIKFSPWGRLIVKNFMFDWWKDLDSICSGDEEALAKHCTYDTIHRFGEVKI